MSLLEADELAARYVIVFFPPKLKCSTFYILCVLGIKQLQRFNAIKKSTATPTIL
jgi:hypothetical protein